jgi:hypothetical protein
MAQDLRAGIAAIIRQDLAEEAAAGFPLLRRFPNSETASVPGYFATLAPPDREILLDALARYSMIQWSHEVVREKQAHPVLGPFLTRRPSYPPGDWYGARPKKSVLKKSVVDRLALVGYARQKRQLPLPPDVMEFAHPDPTFAGHVLVSFDPGFPRQLDFGLRDWICAGLRAQFALPEPRAFIPAIRSLAYDHLWDGGGTNNPVCWDVITVENLEETGNLVVEVLDRLSALAGRINRLAPEHVGAEVP